MRKNLLKILLIPIIGLFFSGCYTALWMPDGDNANYDSEDIQSSEDANYYQLNDYGSYYYYYNRPWWFNAVQAAQSSIDKTKNDASLRKNDAGRGEFTRTGDRAAREIPEAPLPAVSASAPPATTSSSTSSSTPKDNSGNRTESSGSSANSSRDRNSNDNSQTRKNDGNRNTSGR
jgi:hypothetical protein